MHISSNTVDVPVKFQSDVMPKWSYGSKVILRLQDFMRSYNKTFYQILKQVHVFYASAFRRRRHYVFGLSVHPSVRSLKYPLLTCTWVHWSTRPTVTVLQHVRLSVRPSVRPSVRRGFRAFAGECMGGLASNFTCWCILTIFRTD